MSTDLTKCKTKHKVTAGRDVYVFVHIVHFLPVIKSLKVYCPQDRKGVKITEQLWPVQTCATVGYVP